MPYFFILPGFVLYVFAISVAIVVTIVYKPVAHLRRLLTSLLIWSSFGFVVSTLAYVIALVISVKALDHVVSGKPSVVGGVVLGSMVFVVPFVAAAVGLIGGGVVGVRRCLKSERAAQPFGADR
jgi:hypothetical protein